MSLTDGLHSPRGYRSATTAILLIYFVFGLGLLYTRVPQADEGTFGNAGYLFATQGYLGMPTVESAGHAWLNGLDRYMYWNMPLYMLTVGVWFKVFGVSIFGQRMICLLFGAAASLSWQFIVWKLTNNRRLALLALALVALNYDVLNVASIGRIDMMAAALWALAGASYLGLRERSLHSAMAATHTLLAMSVMTHPYGVFGGFMVCSFMVWLDRSRIRISHMAVAVLPYLVAAAGWGLYAMQRPDLARAQLLGNASAGRLNGIYTPIATLLRELSERYIKLYAGWRPGVPLAMRLKTLVLLAYLGAYCLLWLPTLRRKQGHGFFLFLMTSFFLLLTYFENVKWYVYLIHVIPVYSCVLALAAGHFWEHRSKLVAMLPRLVVLGLIAFHLASVGFRVRLDSYHKAYLPAAQFLTSAVKPGEWIMASSEFAHAMRFNGFVKDDYRLGYYSGIQPTFIVVEKQFQEWFDFFSSNPDLSRHIARVLAEGKTLLFEIEQGSDYYRIYGPPDRAPTPRRVP